MLSLGSHTNLVQVFALCKSIEKPAIIMEYAALGTLLQFLRSKKEPLDIAVNNNLIVGIAKGIRCLHKSDIIHCDLAARNILLKEGLHPMVSDFGLSCVTATNSEFATSENKCLPLKWMAPETIKTQRFSKMTDIWTFGIVIWEIITKGAEVHSNINDDIVEIKVQIRDNFLTPEIPQKTDSTLKVLMKQCWYKDPEMRPSPKDIIDMIKERDLG